MIEVVVGRGDSAEACELVAAMGRYESAGYRPIPDYSGSFWGEREL
jgi:hypothetical protein